MMNKENKVKKNLTLSPATIEYLSQYIEEYKESYHKNLSYSQAIDTIIANYKNLNIDDIHTEKIVTSIKNEYDPILKRIKQSTYNMDINIQVLLEMLNSLLMNIEVEQYYDTDKIPNAIYVKGKLNVIDKIGHQKQRKDHNAKKNKS